MPCSPWNQELHKHQPGFPASAYNFYSSTNGRGCNTKPQSPLPKESFLSFYQSSGEQQIQITILQAMKHLVSSWNAVSKEAIVNCFNKFNISQSNQQAAVNDDDDPFKSLQEDLKKLHELDNDAIQPNQLNHLLI